MSQNEPDGTPPQGEDALTRPVDKGMMPVYIMTNFFLETIINPRSLVDLSKKVVLTDWEAILHSLEHDWEIWIDHHYGFFICVVFSVATCIGMMVVAVVVCVCRCHGKCGGKVDKVDDKNTVYKRRGCTLALSTILVPLMLGTVALFIGNQLAYEETLKDGMAYTFDDSLGRLSSFQKDTINSYDTIIANDFRIASQELIENLDHFGEHCLNTIEEHAQASVLFDQLKTYVSQLNQTKQELMSIEELSEDMASLSERLDEELFALRQNMTIDMEPCRDNNSYCEIALQRVEDLEVVINASQLIGATQDSIDIIDDVTNGDETISDGLNKAIEEYRGIQNSIEETASDQIKILLTATEASNVEVQIFINFTTFKMNGVSFTSAQNYVNQSLSPWIQTAGDIRYYSCLAVGCFIIIIAVLYAIALAYGICGERPTVEATCCNRGNGAGLLVTTAYLTLASSGIFLLATSLLVVPGGIVHTDVCRHMVNLEDGGVLQVFDDMIAAYTNINISALGAYQNCSKGQTIYTATGFDALGSEFNVSHMVDKELSTINTELNVLNTLNYTSTEVILLNDALRMSLTSLAEELHQLDFSDHRAQIRSNITSLDLQAFAEFLAEAADHSNEMQDVFMTYSEKVQSIQNEFMPLFASQQDEMNSHVKKTSEFINGTQPLDMIDKLNKTETSLKDNLIEASVHGVTEELQEKINEMFGVLEKQIREDVGKCDSVYTAIADSVTEACVFFLYPFNAYWLCLGWCIFFLAFTVPIAIILAGYYEKTQKFTKTDVPSLTFENMYASVPSVHRQRRKGPGPPACTLDVTQLEFEMLDVDSYERHSDHELNEQWSKGFGHEDEDEDGGFKEFQTQARLRRQLSDPRLDDDDVLYASTFNPNLIQECVTSANDVDPYATTNLAYRSSSHVYDSPLPITPPGEGPDPYTPYVNDDLNFQFDNPGYGAQIPEPQSTGINRANVNCAYF
ncbi:hypothetical protein CAPTEDRAFT_208379 [Capitella teleta]|uniref:Prominin-1-A-like n=1 Tax=Capitella teleta TaxID=283909 RepID=R7TUX7_CAPTE|nr:hypothetical protein CAPTEDRAFT_208379 [Capitella teleta]|eukprot:ELT94795.1 hypothetical protein CAPTEDRAFT_208379 [Capitella teleta]